MPKYILINDQDYKYVDFRGFEQVDGAISDYLFSKYSVTDFVNVQRNANPIAISNDEILYCCDFSGSLDLGDAEYDPALDMEDIIDNEFGGNASEFVDYLTENGMMVVDNDFDKYFKDFFDDVVFDITRNKLKGLQIDYDDMFASINREHGVDIAIECLLVITGK